MLSWDNHICPFPCETSCTGCHTVQPIRKAGSPSEKENKMELEMMPRRDCLLPVLLTIYLGKDKSLTRDLIPSSKVVLNQRDRE